MDLQRHVQVLRVQLLGMARLSQYAPDCSIKQCEPRSSVFFTYVLKHRVRTPRKLLPDQRSILPSQNRQRPSPSESRFSQATLCLNRALCRTYRSTAQPIKNTISFLGNNLLPTWTVLDRSTSWLITQRDCASRFSSRKKLAIPK